MLKSIVAIGALLAAASAVAQSTDASLIVHRGSAGQWLAAAGLAYAW